MANTPVNTINSISANGKGVMAGYNSTASKALGGNTMSVNSIPKTSPTSRQLEGLNRIASTSLGGLTDYANSTEMATREAREYGYGTDQYEKAKAYSPDKELFDQFMATVGKYVDMTPEEEAFYYKQSGLIAHNGGNALEWAQEYLTINAISNVTGLSRENVMASKDALLDYYLGIQADHLDFTNGGSFINAFHQGVRQQELAELKDQYRDLFAKGYTKDDPRVQKAYKDVVAKVNEMSYYADYTPHKWYVDMANSAVSQIPYMAKGTASGFLGSAVGSLLGPVGAKIGGGLARIGTYYGQFAGDAFWNMLEAGASVETALKYSSWDGLGNALNEALLDAGFEHISSSVLGGLGFDVGIQYYPNILRAVAGNGSLLKFGAEMLWYLGSEASGEFIQEATQSLWSSLMLAKAIEDDRLDVSVDWSKNLRDAMEEGFQGFVVGMVFGSFGAIKGAGIDLGIASTLKSVADRTNSREMFANNKGLQNLVMGQRLNGGAFSREQAKKALGQLWDNVHQAKAEVAAMAARQANAKAQAEANGGKYKGKAIKGQRDITRKEDGRIRLEPLGFQRGPEGNRVTIVAGSSKADGNDNKATRYGTVTILASPDGKTATIESVNIEPGYESHAAEILQSTIEDYVQGYENVEMGDQSPLAQEIADELAGANPDGAGLKYRSDNAEKARLVNDLLSANGPLSENISLVESKYTDENGVEHTVTRATGLISRDEAILVASVIENLAKRKGMTIQQYLDKYFNGSLLIDPTDTSDTRIADAYEQGGSFSGFSSTSLVGPDGILTNLRGLIYVATSGDFSTFLHEIFHLNLRIDPEARQNVFNAIKNVLGSEARTKSFMEYLEKHSEVFRRNGINLSASQIVDVLKAMKSADELIEGKGLDAEEAITSLFEAWLADENKSESLPEGIRAVFSQIAKAMQRIYRTLVGQDVRIDKEIEDAFIKAMNFLGEESPAIEANEGAQTEDESGSGKKSPKDMTPEEKAEARKERARHFAEKWQKVKDVFDKHGIKWPDLELILDKVRSKSELEDYIEKDLDFETSVEEVAKGLSDEDKDELFAALKEYEGFLSMNSPDAEDFDADGNIDPSMYENMKPRTSRLYEMPADADPEIRKQGDGYTLTDDDYGKVILSESQAKASQQIKNGIDKLLVPGTDPNKYSPISFGAVSKRLADDVKKQTGVDISGVENILEFKELKHIMNRHMDGLADVSKLKKDDVPLTRDDIQLIPYILDNYDKVSASVNKSGDVKLRMEYYDKNKKIRILEKSVLRVSKKGKNPRMFITTVWGNVVHPEVSPGTISTVRSGDTERNNPSVNSNYNAAENPVNNRRQLSEGISSEAQRQYDEVRAKYYGTDQWLKAPNGKDTNLTERQWVQVRTPNFIRWFGDWINDPQNASKIVDENGEPKPVYHGTSHYGFDVFEKSKIRENTGAAWFGKGFYFDMGDGDKADGYMYQGGGDSEGVYSVFLNIRNPLDWKKMYSDVPYDLGNYVAPDDFFYDGHEGADWDISEAPAIMGLWYNMGKMFPGRFIEEIELNGSRFAPDEVYNLVEKYASEGHKFPFLKVANELGIDPDGIVDDPWLMDEHVEQFHQLNVIDKLVSEGVVDGVINASLQEDEAVVFDSRQIKSSTDNNGDFNPDDERIRYQLAPEGYEPKKVGHGVKMFEMDLETGELFPLFLNKRYIMDENGVEREAIAYNDDGSEFDYDNATEKDFPHHYEKGSYEKPIVQGRWLIADDNRQKGFSARPGWHLGANVPYGPWLVSTQGVYNAKRGNKTRHFARVWAEVSYTMDKDYQEELDRTGKKDIKNHIPEDGYYFFREANGSTWVITGAIKIDRIMTTREAYERASQVVGDFEQGIVDYPNNHYNGTVEELRENWRKYLELSDEREGIISRLYPTEAQRIERDYSVGSGIAEIAADIRRQGDGDESDTTWFSEEEFRRIKETPSFGPDGRPSYNQLGRLRYEDVETYLVERYNLEDKNAFALFYNEDTDKYARFSKTSVDKMVSVAAAAKSRKNGYSYNEHNEVAMHVEELFRNAILVSTSGDKGNSADIDRIERYETPFRFRNEDTVSIAYFTVKGHKGENNDLLYSVELKAVKKAPSNNGVESPIVELNHTWGYKDGNTSGENVNSDASVKNRRQGAGGVESAEFKRWFGNSVVVDDNGKPLELVHGSFDEFDTFGSTTDIGYHFGTMEQAEEVLFNKANDNYMYSDAEPRFYKVYARIENPIVFSQDMASWTGDNRQFLQELRSEGYLTSGEYAEMVRMGDENQLYNDTGDASELNARLKEMLVSKGYDGIVYPNHFEGVTFDQDGTRGYDRSYMVFSPNQVKSSTDNNGNYSLSDDNIRHQGAGGFTVVSRNMTVAEQNGYKMTVHADGSMTVTGNIDNFRSDIQSSNVSDAMKDKVKGQLVGKGRKLEIAPSTAKVARDLISGGQFASRGGMVFSDYYKDSNGKVVGAPSKYDTPQKIAQGLRPLMVQLTKEGVMGRMWYEDSSNAILNATGNDTAMAERLADIYAILSPQMTVPGNTTLGINAWYQSLMAEIFPDRVVKVKTGPQNTNLLNLTRGIKWDGQKTNNFSINLRRAFGDVGAGDMGVTVDMWMMRAFGYDSDSPSDAQYFFVENEVNKLVKLLNEEGYDGGNWEPQQVQAAIWVALKARTEDETVKRETEEESQKKGYMHYITNSKGKKERVLDNPAAHRMVWLKHAMEYDYSRLDHTNANYNFSTGMWANIGQVSWEAAPSFGSGVLHGYFDADEDLKRQYLKDIASIFVDENGVDQLAKMVGLLYMGQVQAPGAWSDPATGEVSVSPGMQNIYSISAKDSPAYDWKGNPVLKANGEAKMTKSVTPEAVEALNLYSAILGYLLKQDGVGWNKLMPGLNASEESGFNIELGRPLTEDESVDLEKTIMQVVDEYNRMMEGEDVQGYKPGKKHPSTLFSEEYEWMKSRAPEGATKLISAGDIGLISSKDGMMLVNFTKTNEIDGVEYSDGRYVYGLPNRLFGAIINTVVNRFVENHNMDCDGAFAKHESGLIWNDWEENKDGRAYQNQARETGRSDLFTAAVLQFGPQVRNTMASYSEKYGWGDIGTDPTSIITEEDRESLRKRMLSGRRLQGAPLNVSPSIESKLNSFVSDTTPFGEGRSSLVEDVKRDAYRLSRDIAEEDFDTDESLARERGAVSDGFVALIEGAFAENPNGHEYAFEFPAERYQGNQWGKVYKTDQEPQQETSQDIVNASGLDIGLMTGSEGAKDRLMFLAADDDNMVRTVMSRMKDKPEGIGDFPEVSLSDDGNYSDSDIEKVRASIKESPRKWRELVSGLFDREDIAPSMTDLPEIDFGNSAELEAQVNANQRLNLANSVSGDYELERAVRYGTDTAEGLVEGRLASQQEKLDSITKLMNAAEVQLKEKEDFAKKLYEDFLEAQRMMNEQLQDENEDLQEKNKTLGTSLKRTQTNRDKWRKIAREKQSELNKVTKERDDIKRKFEGYKKSLKLAEQQKKVLSDIKNYKLKLAKSLFRKWNKSIDFRTVAPLMQEIRARLTPKFARSWIYDPINNPNGDKGGETMAYEDAKRLVEDVENGTVGALAGVTKKELRDRLGSKLYDMLSGEGAQPLDEWSIQDLERLNQKLEQAWAEGRQIQEARKQARLERRKEMVNGIVDQGMKSKGYRKNSGHKVVGSVSDRRRGSAFRGFWYSTKRMQELAGLMDGPDGADNRSLLVDQVREAQEQEVAEIERRTSPVHAIIKAINDKLGKMHVEEFFYQKTFTFDLGTGPKEYTGTALAYVYLAQYNELAKEAVAFGNLVDKVEKGDRDADGNLIQYSRTIADDEELKRVGMERFDQLLAFATNELNRAGVMPVVDAIRADLESKENSKALLDFSLDVWNQPIALEEHYLPVRRMDAAGVQEIKSPQDVNLVSGNYLAKVKDGFLEEKRKFNPRHQKPVNLDLLGVWTQSVEQQEHLKSTGELLSDINYVYERSEMVRDTIERAYGPEMLNEIADYTQYVADPSYSDVKNDVTKSLRFFQGSTAAAYLSWKLSSLITQLVSSPAPFVGEAKAGDLLKGYSLMMVKPMEMWDFVTSRSTMMKNRSADLMMQSIKDAVSDPTDTKLAKAWQKFQATGMVGLEWVDKYCVAGGWLAVYNTRLNEFLAQGMSTDEADKAASKAADEVVYRTQPTGTKTENARMYRSGNAILRLLLQFQSAMNVVWNNVTGDMKLDFDKARRGDKKAVQRIIGHTVGYAMAGIILGAIQEGFKDKDDDDEERLNARRVFTVLDWALSQPVESAPFLGSILSDAMERTLTGSTVFSSSSNLFPVARDLIEGVSTMAGAAWKDDEEKRMKALKNGTKKVLKGAGIAAGVPTSAVNQVVKSVDEQSFMPLLGRN